MVVVKTAGGVTTRVRTCPWSKFPRFQEWTVLIPESPKSCQYYFEISESSPACRGFGGMHRRARSSRALKKPVLRRRFRLV